MDHRDHCGIVGKYDRVGAGPHQALAREMGAAWVGGADAPLPARVDGGILFAPVGELVPVALRSIEKGGTLAVAASPTASSSTSRTTSPT